MKQLKEVAFARQGIRGEGIGPYGTFQGGPGSTTGFPLPWIQITSNVTTMIILAHLMWGFPGWVWTHSHASEA
jgi:hypothetical protein